MTSLLSTDRDTRIALVTASLSATGALIGAVCAASSMAIIAATAGGRTALTLGGMPALLAVAAAFVGIIGAPMLGWGLMREVPLGRVILITALGTIGGALIGEWTHAQRT